MNVVEHLVYNMVKANPRLKMRIVGLYQKVCALVPQAALVSAGEVKVRPRSFFGFHDKCPWSRDNARLLAHRFDLPYRPTRPEDSVEVGFFAGPDFMTFKPIAGTRAWSWQQGASLQWVGANDRILFNDWDGENHVARVVDAEGRPMATLLRPVATVNDQGTHGVGFQFRRFEDGLPGYGYVHGRDPDSGISAPSRRGSGLHVIDLHSGAMTELFTPADLVAIKPHPTMAGALNFISHALFSPSGVRFAFFHRWLVDGNRLWTRMFTCDLDGGNLHLFPTSGMVSHIGWNGPDRILGYARTGAGEGYFLFHDLSEDCQGIGENAYNSDGHPQVSPDGKFMLTDTYPDRFRLQYLTLYDFKRHRRYDLARTHLPFKFARELQVDLNPRWNRDGTMVCFDAGFTGERSLCTLAVNPEALGSH